MPIKSGPIGPKPFEPIRTLRAPLKIPAPQGFSALRPTFGKLSLRVRTGDLANGQLTVRAAASILQRTNFQADIEREAFVALRQELALPVLELVQLTSHRGTDLDKLNWQDERAGTAVLPISVSDLIRAIENDYLGFSVANIKQTWPDIRWGHAKGEGPEVPLDSMPSSPDRSFKFSMPKPGVLLPDFFTDASERFGEWCKSLDTDQIPE